MEETNRTGSEAASEETREVESSEELEKNVDSNSLPIVTYTAKSTQLECFPQDLFSSSEKSAGNSSKETEDEKKIGIDEDTDTPSPAGSTETGDFVAPPSLWTSISVHWQHCVFSFLVLLVYTSSICINISLAFIHYNNGRPWLCNGTILCLVAGSFSLLNQLDSTIWAHFATMYRRPKMIKFLVKIFPPLLPIFLTYKIIIFAHQATKDPIFNGSYYLTEKLMKGYCKALAVFESAPQSFLQLVALLLYFNDDTMSMSQGFYLLLSAALSIFLMTYVSTPARIDRRADVSLKSRVYLYARMYSSFASRIMSLSFFFVGCRCILHRQDIINILLLLAILLAPRFVFYVFTLISNEGGPFEDETSFLPFYVTIFFPVGHPYWLYVYISVETILMVVFGAFMQYFIPSCSLNNTDAYYLYPSLFFLFYMILPNILPYAKYTTKVKRRRNQFHRLRESETGTENSAFESENSS